MIGLNSKNSMGRALAFGSVVAGLVLGSAPRAGAEGVSFTDSVWPIVQERCISCHGGEKDKGGLKMDSLEAFTKGGEDGPIFVAGKPEESALYKLIILPKDDPDIMPAKGDPLTADQAKIIQTWIAEGANFGDWKGGAPAAAAAPVDPLEVLAQNTAPADAPLLEAVSALGGLAMPLDMKSPLVRVDYHLIGDTIGDEQLDTLTPLAAQLTWLNLAGTKITDAGLAKVAALPKLTRLHLERTGITDAGVAQLCGLSNLEYLNLYGTQVTDAGIAKLAPLSNLKKIFLWQTPVTAEGAAALQAALPNVKIDRGIEASALPATEIAKVIPKEMFTADSCCAKAAAENKVCDHPCCVEARKGNTVCTKCNAGAEALLAIVAKFDADGCCAKAYAGGKLCDHPCCVEAWAAKTACAKCNPKGAAAPAPEAAPAPAAELKFDDGSCCAKAKAEGKECDHPCCVEARKAGKVCAKCNPNSAAAPAAAEIKFDEGSCCAKAKAEGKECDHPCCVEARKACKSCPKCNPKAAEAALKYDDGSCCAKARAEGKVCDHPCCVEAVAAGKACAKCNPKSAETPAPVAELKFKDGGCCALAKVAGKTCDHPCCVEAAKAGAVCKKCNPDA